MNPLTITQYREKYAFDLGMEFSKGTAELDYFIKKRYRDYLLVFGINVQHLINLQNKSYQFLDKTYFETIYRTHITYEENS